MATNVSRVLYLVRRARTPLFQCYLQQQGKRGFDVSQNHVLPLCRAQSFDAGNLKFDRQQDGDLRRKKFLDDVNDEFSDHHLAESTKSKLEQLARQHRAGSVAEQDSDSSESKSFSDFPLNAKLIETLERLGYKAPFPIQLSTLEHTLDARDVIGQAVTGSGKTLAFAIPIVNKLYDFDSPVPGSRRGGNPRAIVLAPTRELCNQIYRSIQELDDNVRCTALYGGANFERQQRELQRGVDVVCATPGRLNDHLDRGNINLKNVEFLCLDEADEMLTPNFREQIHGIFETSPSEKQVLMFSATMPPEVREIAQRYLKNPVYIDVNSKRKLQAPANIEHQCIKAPASQHVVIAANLVQEMDAQRCIIFTNMKVRSNAFAVAMTRLGLKAQALHSDLSQNRREAILSAFRTGDLRILCATDVAARGLDIPETDLIIQAGPPDKGLEFYIHRSGRTGRAGRKGLAVMLHSGFSTELELIRQISRSIPLKHVSPPEKVNEQITIRKTQKAIDDISKMSEKDVEAFLPAAQKLMDSRQDGVSVIASALAVICRSDVDGAIDAMPTSYSPRMRENFGNMTYQVSSQFRSNRRRLNDWDDDDDNPRWGTQRQYLK